MIFVVCLYKTKSLWSVTIAIVMTKILSNFITKQIDSKVMC